MSIKTYIQRNLSVRISLWVVTVATLLFVAVLWIMLWFARYSIEEEAIQKARATLDTATLHIENELSKVETAVRNIRGAVEEHLDNPDVMMRLSRQVLETNPIIEGCNIAFSPDFYPQKGRNYMAYSHRVGNNVVSTDDFSRVNFDEQSWFADAVNTGSAEWADPLEVSIYTYHPITSYSMPFYRPADKECKSPAGVISVDLSLEWLSATIQNMRPFPNTSCAVINKEGSFIIHPDTMQLKAGTVQKLLEKDATPEARRLVEAMMNGESGSMAVRLAGIDSYVFYRPFKTSGWSLNIVCPESEIFGSYHQLFRLVVIITVVGLLVLLLFCLFYLRWQLSPLRRLDVSAQHLAEGNFDTPIPDTSRQDEIGQMQRVFRSMQQSLAAHLDKISLQSKNLEARGEELQAAYQRSLEAENAKSVFMRSATDQLAAPVAVISNIVGNIRDGHDQLTQKQMEQMTTMIHAQTQLVTDLLDRMLEISSTSTTQFKAQPSGKDTNPQNDSTH